MKERPILFSAEMIRAILEGRKTQTRRVIKQAIGKPDHVDNGIAYFVTDHQCGVESWQSEQTLACPYGQPGDRLWMRETFRLRADQDHKPPSQDWWKSGAWYQADGNCEPSGCGGGSGKLRPSIHMPRWASRITLEITDVGVQRLQEISESDAMGEGAGATAPLHEEWDGDPDQYRKRFRELWDSINAKRCPWDSNCWVWCISFKRVIA